MAYLDCAERTRLIKAALDREEPGWTQSGFFCFHCKNRHELVAEPKQMQLVPGQHIDPEPRKARHGLPSIKGKPEGWCRWHETISPEINGPCAFCGTELHVHQDDLGHVRSGATGKGYMIQYCPACHKPNAVHPLHGGQKGIRTTKIDGGTPAIQLSGLGK